jgi:hemerythrin
MRIVEWEDRYNLGIDDIDQHHRHLLELLNRSYNAVIMEQNKNEVRYIFHELLEYADYHFSAEEAMMKRYGYARTDMHLAEHETFRQKVNDLLDRLLGTGFSFDVELICFLEEWLLNHILHMDREYAEFFRANSGVDG